MFILNSAQGQTFETLVNNLDFGSEYSALKKEVDSLLLVGESENNLELLTWLAGKFSLIEYRKKHYEHALKYGNRALGFHERLNTVDDELALLLIRRALYTSKLNQTEEALEIYKQVTSLKAFPKRVAQAYCLIGQIYGNRGDYYSSIQYYTNGIGILEDQKDYKKLLNQYPNLAIIYSKIGTNKSSNKGLEILDKAAALKKKINFRPDQEFSLNDNYAAFYSNEITFDLQKARYYYNLNLALSKVINYSDYECLTYTNLADLYNIAKKDSAHYFIEKALRICKDSTSLSVANHQLSKYHSLKMEFPEALRAIHASLLIDLNIEKDIDYIPTKEDIIKGKNYYAAMSDLAEKANVFLNLFKLDQDMNNLELALQNILAADKAISLLQKNSTEEESQLFWRKEASRIYHQGVLICALTDQPKLAFQFTEKNKALLLTEDIVRNAKKKELPLEIRSKENNFKKNILSLKNALDSIQESENLSIKKRELFEYNLQFEKYHDSLKTVFPSYFESKMKSEIFSVQNIQENIEADTALISYIWNKDQTGSPDVYGVAITTTESEIFEIDPAIRIKELVSSFRASISQPYETKKDQEQFQEISSQLYNALIPDKIRHLISDKKLVIIPDGALQYTPFEALISQKDTNKFLIQEHIISYAYSASFLLHNRNIQRKTTEEFVGFAPVHFNHNKLESLRHSATEINNIYERLNGHRFLEKEASKAAFFEQVKNHKIVHLATHADASSNPWIAFRDSKLEAHELYTLENPAELIVLSGCNTSLGEIAQGEGVMSLSRGFFYAGAHSVASTLWSANDKSTLAITTDFYDHMKSGESKAEALRSAKISYLENSTLSERSPYYWAPIILMGDSEKVLFPKSYSNIFLIVGILLTLFIVGFLLKRKNKGNK